ncbi:ABC transporter ATP-binding protein [Hellea balneolensis]|uniref:ABC transporter ATP-binding protein n=1 Tax=Hellea balneolensis TaxID=287478 RepID=UPI000429D4A8|nr:ABC transporter ATP-binding protein [Hellea balneolensis]
MTSALRVSDLSVRYGKHHALKNIDVEIASGELIGIIGPNGAGKTSFIKALCGRVNYDGYVEIADARLKRGHDRQKLLGLVPQDIGLYGHMSARENLTVFAKIMGLPKTSRKTAVEDALIAVGMSGKANDLVSALSGGMKRRINVAAAIMHNPTVIIFDEPTAGVDVPARDTLHRLARKLAERGIAVLLVTHELEQAEALCDKVLILCDGAKLDFDTPPRILSRNFAGMREVMVRYASPPEAEVVKSMKPFEFSQGELPTIWTAMTQASEVSFVSAFMTALKNRNDLVREVSVRRPGLTSLMHRIEQTGTCQ